MGLEVGICVGAEITFTSSMAMSLRVALLLPVNPLKRIYVVVPGISTLPENQAVPLLPDMDHMFDHEFPLKTWRIRDPMVLPYIL